ncbi:hypothetical protein L1D14_25905 [Vibrio tubiashii]|uniref:hypothetical protein n=1 Tax=Vibrio tubiashii TaxID=29498 RepID=UPI001EFC93C0|nr:hypothetical protein [Vibrio tubiashii]MCG9579646.1 hypothetical protein [Vibrio tubiashii]
MLFKFGAERVMRKTVFANMLSITLSNNDSIWKDFYHKSNGVGEMQENIDSTVDGLKLVVINNPKDLSQEAMIALYEMAKEENLNAIEFKNEKGEVKHTIPVSLKADWSN